jgi:hypothetical protein
MDACILSHHLLIVISHISIALQAQSKDIDVLLSRPDWMWLDYTRSNGFKNLGNLEA